MRLAKTLAVVNALAAATVLVVVALVTDVAGMRVPTSTVVDTAKATDPTFGLDALSRGVSEAQHRANVLKWLCYGTLPVFALNAFCWATTVSAPSD